MGSFQTIRYEIQGKVKGETSGEAPHPHNTHTQTHNKKS